MTNTHLFSSIQFKEITLKNRIVVSPMCQYSSDNGFANDWHFVHLGTRAIGGAGLIFTEATAVLPEGRISPADLGIWSDEHISFLTKIVNFITEHGSIAAMQLAHAGRKGSTQAPWDGHGLVPIENGGWQPIAPSALTYSEHYATPKELSTTEITTIIEAFVQAAKRAFKAGFKIIEIHAAHGYLIHEFLSPLTNHRQDNYGGSLVNRARLLLEIIDAVKTIWPAELPIFVRISATDWAVNGWDLAQSIQLAQLLKNKNIDLIDVSSGGLIPEQQIPHMGAGYQTPFATQIRKEANIATGAVGLITSATQASHIIHTEQADLVFLARELLRNPYWPLHAAKELKQTLGWPKQYARAVL